MNKKFTLALLAPLVLSGIVACNTAPHRDDRHYLAHSYYEHPLNQDDYYYYPNSNVYFHIYSGNYYYRNNNQWIRNRHLPKHTYLDQRVRRQLVVKEKEPYHHHREHKQKYRDDSKRLDGKKSARLKQEQQDPLHEKQRKRVRHEEKRYR